ncbi:MAG: UvrD-helicase domain-containing protein [Thermodesulfobacteriota bacterium]
MTPDPAQAPFLLLTASAGSGKTFALTRRFLDLLAEAGPADAGRTCRRDPGSGYGWPEILAVTFTLKAAAEMQERILRSLKERALGQDPDGPARAMSPARAKAWIERLLRQLHQLNVRTIDSLLHLFLALFAPELGLPPDFDPAFDLEELFDELYDAVCAEAEAGDPAALAVLDQAQETLLVLDNAPGFDLFARTRTRLLPLLALRLTDRTPYLSDPARLHARLAALLRSLQDSARDMADILEQNRISPVAHFTTFLGKLRNLDPSQPPPISAYGAKAGLDDCLPKAAKGSAPQAAEAAYASLREAYAAYLRGRPLLARARGLAGFLNLADALAAALPDLERRRGLLLNLQWPEKVREVLENGPPEVFCRLGARLRHLLLDEFQDTSRGQWEAMRPLAEECLSKGGGVFAVGDVKQAIYGWRGGEARLFAEMAAPGGLSRICPAIRDTLPFNWRSHREVVGFVNRCFGPLGDPDRAAAVARAMVGASGKDPGDGRAEALLAASLAESFAGCEQKVPDRHAATSGLVRLYAVRGENREDLFERARAVLAEVFADLRERRPLSDLAVLVRSNTQARAVARWLLDLGIPVVTENSVSLAEHPLVRWLAAFLAWLDFPADDLAFWEVTQAPHFRAAAGLDQAKLVDWLAGEARPPLSAGFRERFPAAWEAWLAPFHAGAGFMTPYDALREISLSFGLERDPGDAAFVRRFLEVAHAAEKEGRQTLSAFLDWWRENGGEESVPLPETLEAVRIMTIHGAKGLEFPAVVVPFHHWRFDLSGRLGAADLDGDALLAFLDKDMGPAWDRAMASSLQEDLNLLYVAWTRAKEELHGLVTRSDYYDKRSPLLAALDALLGEAPWTGERCGVPSLEIGQVPDPADRPAVPSPAAAPAQAPAGPLPPARRPMAWLPRLKIHRHFSKDVSREELFSRPGFDEMARGTVFHEALAGLAGGRMDSAAAARAALALHAPSLPPDHEERGRLLAQVRDALDWVLSRPDLAEAIRAGQPEQSILDAEGNIHRADLVALLPERAVVLEYKTGGPDPAHAAQVRRYLGLLAGADPGRPARGLLVYLDRRQVEEVA